MHNTFIASLTLCFANIAYSTAEPGLASQKNRIQADLEYLANDLLEGHTFAKRLSTLDGSRPARFRELAPAIGRRRNPWI